jgi:hypothetical protein
MTKKIITPFGLALLLTVNGYATSSIKDTDICLSPIPPGAWSPHRTPIIRIHVYNAGTKEEASSNLQMYQILTPYKPIACLSSFDIVVPVAPEKLQKRFRDLAISHIKSVIVPSMEDRVFGDWKDGMFGEMNDEVQRLLETNYPLLCREISRVFFPSEERQQSYTMRFVFKKIDD